jgi:hypothetical protein
MASETSSSFIRKLLSMETVIVISEIVRNKGDACCMTSYFKNYNF